MSGRAKNHIRTNEKLANNFNDNYYRYLGTKDYMIPREIIERIDLTPQEKLVYGVIYTLSQNTNGSCKIRQSHIAALTACSESFVSQSVRKLRRLGLIEVYRHIFPKNGGYFAQPSSYKPVPIKRRTGRAFPVPLRVGIQYLTNSFTEYFNEIKL